MTKSVEEKAKHAEYMREYTKQNKEVINARKSERRKERIDSGDLTPRTLHNAANKRYYDANKGRIRTRCKELGHSKYTEKKAAYGKKHRLKYPTKNILAAIKNRAKNKDIPFDLTLDWYDKEFAKGCAVTGIELDISGSKTSFTAHVDRKIPDLGYVQSNCQLVCASYNIAKKDWTHEDVIYMAYKLIEFDNK